MLTKPVYEALPYGYMALGIASFMLLDPNYALIAAAVIFVLGARIYTMRSQNRRTDPIKRSKSGGIPKMIYDLLPFLYLLGALSIFKFLPEKFYPFISHITLKLQLLHSGKTYALSSS